MVAQLSAFCGSMTFVACHCMRKVKIVCAHSLKLSMYYLCAGSGLHKSHPTDFDGQGHCMVNEDLYGITVNFATYLTKGIMVT